MGNKITYYYSCDENLTPHFDATHQAEDPTVTFVVMAEMDCVAKVFKIVSDGFLYIENTFYTTLKRNGEIECSDEKYRWRKS